LSPKAQEEMSQFPADWPEIEYLFVSSGRAVSNTAQSYASIAVTLIASVSRGNVTIRSNSMLDKPVISTNWFSEPTDQEVAVQGYKRAREIWSYMPSITVGPEAVPGANITTDEDILKAIRANAAAVHHASSTCE
jgi:choline dehydrogenase